MDKPPTLKFCGREGSDSVRNRLFMLLKWLFEMAEIGVFLSLSKVVVVFLVILEKGLFKKNIVLKN